MHLLPKRETQALGVLSYKVLGIRFLSGEVGGLIWEMGPGSLLQITGLFCPTLIGISVLGGTFLF